MSNLQIPVEWDKCGGVRSSTVQKVDYMHHAGITKPMFAVTEIGGLH